MLTAPVGSVTLSNGVLTAPEVAKLMPPLPDVKVTLGDVKVPLPVILEVVPEAVRVADVGA